MAIKVGDRIPSVIIKSLTDDGIVDIDTAAFLGMGRVILFAVPGAFTPTCSARHLPGYVSQAAALKAKGIDKIVCLAVNDPFVMKAWLEQNDATHAIIPLADGNADFTTALGLTFDGSGFGLGTRAQRFAMLIELGTVKTLNVEMPGQFSVSSCEAMLQIV